jgi:hypothetical protein
MRSPPVQPPTSPLQGCASPVLAHAGASGKKSALRPGQEADTEEQDATYLSRGIRNGPMSFAPLPVSRDKKAAHALKKATDTFRSHLLARFAGANHGTSPCAPRGFFAAICLMHACATCRAECFACVEMATGKEGNATGESQRTHDAAQPSYAAPISLTSFIAFTRRAWWVGMELWISCR